MSAKQQVRSITTRTELSEAMVQLFLEKGYNNTSIKEITEKAGYSVGSFYRHWAGKSHAFMEYWDAYIAEYIRGSVENEPAGDVHQKLDYLIARSDKFSKQDVTIKLYYDSLAHGANYEYRHLSQWVERYAQMLYSIIKDNTTCKDEKRLRSTASILNTVMNTHAIQNAENTYYDYAIDNDTLKHSIMALLYGLGYKDE